MGEEYAECRKSHSNLGGNVDGCQRFQPGFPSQICSTCNCLIGFHRKVVGVPPVKYKTEIVYTKCHKIHDFKVPNSVDGCQEFTPAGKVATASVTCVVCGCHKGFHRNEIRVEVK